MDRDMVNCLHYIYQWGQITPQLFGAQLFWCPYDTRNPLEGRRVVMGDGYTESLVFSPGVYDLVDMIEGQLRTLPTPNFAFGYPISAPIRAQGERRPAFLAISYAPAFDPVKQTVLAAALEMNFTCEVTGDLGSPGNIMDQVWQGIRGADVVVADVTGSNPNVFYEIGLAHALGKEVILISQDAEAPFDIRASRRIHYVAADLEGLRTQLAAAFGGVSARYPHEGPEPRF
jgi:nucleoside 2-deoxyribosyltransferase